VQFSLFGAAAAPPLLTDLDGVLLAGGQWVRHGTVARLSIVVPDRWRAEALAVAFAQREVGDPAPVAPADLGLVVRSGFLPELVPHAIRWTRGAKQTSPPGLVLTPGGLRLWAIAAGRSDQAGYVLGTASANDVTHVVAGAQLARLGLAGVSLAVRSRPGWRITSARRLRRLAELLGEPPAGAGVDWPR
jgi:hypothetical protein